MQQIVEYTDEDYYGSALIRPPKDFKFFEADTRYTRLIIDSRVRDKSLFPSPNNYEIPFEDDINDVKTARLVSMEVPMPMYLVNPLFCKIYFKVGATPYTATVAHGDYTVAELATSVQAAMDAALPATFQVTYNTRLDNFDFNASVAFKMQFNERHCSLAMLLGFSSEKDYVSAVDALVPSYANLIRSEFRKNFNYNNYLIMDIDQFDVLKSIDRDLNKSFAIIPKTYAGMNIADEASIIKTFSPPIARLTKLRIKFYDRFGNPYDFQNMDHRFEILLAGFKQKRKYNM